MAKRFVAIWFRHLTADWLVRRRPELKEVSFVFAAPEKGRMVVTAVSRAAHAKGIVPGMVVADCRAIFPSLEVYDDEPDRAEKLLTALAEWCIRFTPTAAVDEADGLILDVSGCAHLWGGEHAYLKDLVTRLKSFGYDIRVAMADTVGAAWAVCRYGQVRAIIPTGCQREAILPLPPTALRIDTAVVEKLEKLGLYQVQQFIGMPRSALRRRFGEYLLLRLDQALGYKHEHIEPVCPVQLYQERMPSFEPIRTATGIEIALRKLLQALCERMVKDEIGLRICVLKCYRIDGNIQQIQISTNRPSRHVEHLFKLFELKIPTIEPDLGFELFVLEAPVVEGVTVAQEAMWHTAQRNDEQLAELLDKIGGKMGANTIHRYLPAEHYWPEHSITTAATLQEQPTTAWRTDLPRPIHLLSKPERIEVSVLIPDYPPTLFIYKGERHQIAKADGPERIEQEWWLQEGMYRDYYYVEDESGARYWLFRLGHYTNRDPEWFIHGFFA